MRGSRPCRLALLLLAVAAAAGGHDFRRDFDVVWGEGNARFRDGGREVELSLDERTGARLQSKERYLFGRFDLEIKLVPGESAGTITSFYVSAPLSSICALVNYSTALLRLARIMVQCRSKLPHLVSS